MEVRDPVHGSIPVRDAEISILADPFFERLRRIKQLGFSDYVFPGATHTRYLHSIGVMYVSDLVFSKLFGETSSPDWERLRETLRLGCLLHDLGHAPLSHSSERCMPKIEDLHLPDKRLGHRSGKDQATHEDYTIKAITDSSFTRCLDHVRSKYGVDPEAIADLVQGEETCHGYFQIGGTNYFPLLHQLVSSEMDCDRMDYLLRDSYFCGVSYGKYDLPWILDNLTVDQQNGQALLAITERAISTFDDFLLSRFHMFLMVYFHYRAVCLEEMLGLYFEQAPLEYVIPGDIEQYRTHDDHYLRVILSKSERSWAKRILANDTPEKVLEVFGPDQQHLIDQVLEILSAYETITCSSRGRLSKYYGSESEALPKFPIRVRRASGAMDIHQVTQLYQKFSETHSVTRVYCDLDTINPDTRKKLDKLLASE